MKKQLSTIALLTSVLTVGFAPSVAADYRNTSYNTNSDYVMADVVRTEPIYKTVTVSRPERVCEEVEVYDRRRDRYNRRSRHHHDDTAGGTIAGGIIGGVLGRQIGKGSGRDAATIAGVLIGSAIGHDNANKNSSNRRHSDHRRGHDEYRVRTEQRCQVHTERHTEERMDGYRVTYFLNGQEYQTRTRHKPGAKIRVRVTVQPVIDEGYYDEDDSHYESRNSRYNNDDDYERYDYDDDD